MERAEVDCAHHDLLGYGHGVYRIGSYSGAILLGTLSVRSGGSRFLSGNYCLFESLGAAGGSGASACRVHDRAADFQSHRFPNFGIAVGNPLVRPRRMALALHPRRTPRSLPRDHHDLLFDGLAASDLVALRARTPMDRFGT